MKSLFYSVFALCFAHGINAQKTLQPEVMSYPDISEERLMEHSELAKKYGDLEVRLEDGGAELSESDQQFMADNEMTIIKGPFSTEEPGCSWYCLGGVYKATASSNLSASKTSDYKPLNTHDWDLRTAWATNVNNGIGEKLCYYFMPNKTVSITHLEIYNGYQKSETSWRNNSRAKKIAVSINGEYLYDLELQDTFKMQKFAIGEHFFAEEELQIEFKIVAVYKGDKYNDLCISEINVDGANDH